MKDMINFSANVQEKFQNNYENMLVFNELLMDASNKIYNKYSEKETGEIIRKQLNNIMGVADFKQLNSMKQRQAWREHGKEIASLIENTLVDKMNSGWNAGNARFMSLVDEVNLAEGDKPEFFVQDTSLLTVSKFAGDHHDIVRQAIKPGKSFTIDTSAYTIKVYADFRLFMLGKIDFAGLVQKMYDSIEQTRYAALYDAFKSLDESLPTDMILGTAVAANTIPDIVEHIEAVKAVTGKDVILVGARPAIQKLQSVVSYNIFSDDMINEKNQKGIFARWEGYDCLALDRVNVSGTRTNVFSVDDNKKIYIIPDDPQFKPIKRVNEGDVSYYESGMDGMKKDMTVDAEITYWEGIGIVIDELFGEIKITG